MPGIIGERVGTGDDDDVTARPVVRSGVILPGWGVERRYGVVIPHLRMMLVRGRGNRQSGAGDGGRSRAAPRAGDPRWRDAVGTGPPLVPLIPPRSAKRVCGWGPLAYCRHEQGGR